MQAITLEVSQPCSCRHTVCGMRNNLFCAVFFDDAYLSRRFCACVPFIDDFLFFYAGCFRRNVPLFFLPFFFELLFSLFFDKFKAFVQPLQKGLHFILKYDNCMAVKTGTVGIFAFDNLQKNITQPILFHIKKICPVFYRNLSGK